MTRIRLGMGAVVVAAVLGVLLASSGHAAALPLSLEVSNSCATVPGPAGYTLTIWGHLAANTDYTVNESFGFLQPPPPATDTVHTDVNGNFTVTWPYVTSLNTEGNQDFITIQYGNFFLQDAIQLVNAPGVCPKTTPPPPACSPAGAAIPLQVTGLVPPAGETVNGGTATWFLDYPGAGHNPPSFATSNVAGTTTIATLPAALAGAGHLITVKVVGPLQVTGAPGAVLFTTFPTIPVCPPPPTTTTTTTTTTVAPTTTTTVAPTTTTTVAPTTTTTSTTIVIPPPTTAGPAPVLTIDPQVVTGGEVTEVHGAGFPPNSSVILEWEPGIGIVTAQVGPDGTFTTPFLVIPNDQIGTRLVQASGFPSSVSAPLLVELGPAEPPSADGEWIFRQG